MKKINNAHEENGKFTTKEDAPHAPQRVETKKAKKRANGHEKPVSVAEMELEKLLIDIGKHGDHDQSDHGKRGGSGSGPKSSLKRFDNPDYQGRKNGYPDSGTPVEISSYEDGKGKGSLRMSFKNTSEDDAKSWAEKFAAKEKLNVKGIEVSQTGDYADDWVDVDIDVDLEESLTKHGDHDQSSHGHRGGGTNAESAKSTSIADRENDSSAAYKQSKTADNSGKRSSHMKAAEAHRAAAQKFLDANEPRRAQEHKSKADDHENFGMQLEDDMSAPKDLEGHINSKSESRPGDDYAPMSPAIRQQILSTIKSRLDEGWEKGEILDSFEPGDKHEVEQLKEMIDNFNKMQVVQIAKRAIATYGITRHYAEAKFGKNIAQFIFEDEPAAMARLQDIIKHGDHDQSVHGNRGGGGGEGSKKSKGSGIANLSTTKKLQNLRDQNPEKFKQEWEKLSQEKYGEVRPFARVNLNEKEAKKLESSLSGDSSENKEDDDERKFVNEGEVPVYTEKEVKAAQKALLSEVKAQLKESFKLEPKGYAKKFKTKSTQSKGNYIVDVVSGDKFQDGISILADSFGGGDEGRNKAYRWVAENI